jgi:hypothetical protein
MSKVLTVKFDYYHTDFSFAPKAPTVPTAVCRNQDEKARITRFQVSC